MSHPLLALEGVCKSFGSTPVLRDVSLTLEQGEILFLLGASGCGKTTLLRVIAGFEVAECGRMAIDERVIFDADRFVPPRDRHLGYVLQEGVLFPHLNVWRNIAYGLGNGRGKTESERQRIAEVMALTSISELAERLPHQISGGQQQRVALARALAPRPSIMLLDEPFSALDEHLRARIRDDVIDILRRSQSSAIIVTHDRHEALSCADRIGVMAAGRLMQLDTPKAIYRRPGNPQIARFMSDHSLLLDAHLSADGLCADTRLTGRIPVDIMTPDGAGPAPAGGQPGQVLIRADQLIPTAPDQPGALCTAQVQALQFHGNHSQVDAIAGKTRISLDLGNKYADLRVGDRIGLRLAGKAVFYPQA